MRALWRNLREAMKKLEQRGCSLPSLRLAAVAWGLAAAMAVPAPAQQARPAPAKSPRKAHHAKPKPAVPESIPQVTLPAPPPPERRAPEQMPPGVPQVSWDGSELTINADNSTLADILVAIRTRTAAEIDVPSGASRERIAARLGPGPAREIIATLLSWTDFDYIIQASDDDPAGIHSILLTPREKPDAVVARAGMGNSAAGRRLSHRYGQVNTSPAEVQEPSSSTETETPAEAPVAAAQPAPVEPVAASDSPPEQPDAASNTPRVQANLNPASTAASSDLNPPLASSTQERMQTLQSLYEQRKQMVQDARKPAN
jgi:hypothetical protein